VEAREKPGPHDTIVPAIEAGFVNNGSSLEESRAVREPADNQNALDTRQQQQQQQQQSQHWAVSPQSPVSIPQAGQEQVHTSASQESLPGLTEPGSRTHSLQTQLLQTTVEPLQVPDVVQYDHTMPSLQQLGQLQHNQSALQFVSDTVPFTPFDFQFPMSQPPPTFPLDTQMATPFTLPTGELDCFFDSTGGYGDVPFVSQGLSNADAVQAGLWGDTSEPVSMPSFENFPMNTCTTAPDMNVDQYSNMTVSEDDVFYMPYESQWYTGEYQDSF
jgi:hypothetical protein